LRLACRFYVDEREFPSRCRTCSCFERRMRAHAHRHGFVTSDDVAAVSDKGHSQTLVGLMESNFDVRPSNSHHLMNCRSAHCQSPSVPSLCQTRSQSSRKIAEKVKRSYYTAAQQSPTMNHTRCTDIACRRCTCSLRTEIPKSFLHWRSRG
jgi:hypothetical protein